MDGEILLISGQREVGKTTLCRRVVARAKAAGYTCGGLLTIASDESEERHVIDVRSGEARSLTVASGGVRQGRFRFDPTVIAWGTQLLAQAVPCHLLVVDEIGPLEIERGEGWANAVDVLRGGQFNLALAVVRPELVERVQQILSDPAAVVTVTPENRGALFDVLLDRLETINRTGR